MNDICDSAEPTLRCSPGAAMLDEEVVVDALPATRDWRILVIGLGAGDGVDRLAGRLDHGHVIGVDPSPAMHRLAERRNRDSIRSGRLTLLVSKIDNLPLPDTWVDAVSAVDMLQLAGSLDALALELARVMRPGAPFASVTHEWAPRLRALEPLAWLKAAAAAFEAADFEDVVIAHGRAGGERAMVLRARRGGGGAMSRSGSFRTA